MPQPEILWRKLERLAAPRDVDGAFPREAMRALVEAGLTRPERCGRAVPMGALMGLLREAGRGDANVARLLEGHANALELIDRLAPEPLRERALDGARLDALYGVWGADPPEGRLTARRDGAGFALTGGKLFCSGVDGLDAALTLADAPEDGGRLLLFIPLDGELDIDRSWWTPLGMRASGSHRVDWRGARIGADQVVCDGEAYLADPQFFGGAMRFAAAHAGVARGLAETARAHLVRLGRAGAPHQAGRLGAMAAALEALDGALDRAAESWDAGVRPDAGPEAAARASAAGTLARVAAERALLEIADLAEAAVGCAGLLAPHAFERRLRDARTYVRQPNPDGAREAAGRDFAEGLMDPPAQ